MPVGHLWRVGGANKFTNIKMTAALFAVLVLSDICLGQNPSTFYAESFRKGPTSDQRK
jgi:hypothetical protein